MKERNWLSPLLCVCLLVNAGLATAQAAPASAEEAPFDVYEYRVLGNTVLPAREIEATVYPLLGPGKRLADVEKARDALVATYRKAGFGTVLVDIPEQSVDDGVVRLQVTEGKVGRVEVRGARFFSTREIKQELPAVQPDSVPKLPEFQAQLAQKQVLVLLEMWLVALHQGY